MMQKYFRVAVCVFAAFLNSALAICTLDEIDCCIAEFSGMIRPTEISLSEKRVSAVCTFEDETMECLDLFMDQCSRNETDVKDVEDLVNKTKAYLSQICPPSSDFMARLKDNEMCIMNASETLQSCYRKTVLHSDDEKRDGKNCCEYKEFRNCAVQAVEDKCGATASQLVHEQVVHMNGAVLEWRCSELFSECNNAAGMLASSAILALWSVVFLKILFKLL